MKMTIERSDEFNIFSNAMHELLCMISQIERSVRDDEIPVVALTTVIVPEERWAPKLELVLPGASSVTVLKDQGLDLYVIHSLLWQPPEREFTIVTELGTRIEITGVRLPFEIRDLRVL